MAYGCSPPIRGDLGMPSPVVRDFISIDNSDYVGRDFLFAAAAVLAEDYWLPHMTSPREMPRFGPEDISLAVAARTRRFRDYRPLDNTGSAPVAERATDATNLHSPRRRRNSG